MATHILSLSYGKDSLACLGAIEKLGWPLDGIVHAEIWATDTIPADLPPMVEFKAKADKIIKDRWGIEVEHICATHPDGYKLSFESYFYKVREKGEYKGIIHGFPYVNIHWCNKYLKMQPLRKYISNLSAKNVVEYLGIATNEPNRLKRLDGIHKVSPLSAVGWDEAYCMEWCEKNKLLSPIYTTMDRGGCWFCIYNTIKHLRLVRKNYPDLWSLLLKWDQDSPSTYKPNRHTVHDFERRFFYEDIGLVPCDRTFRWKMLDTARSDWLDSLLA